MEAICNSCGKDYSDSADTGGFIIGDRAICPLCAPRVYQEIEFYQQNIITNFCPKDISFSTFITEQDEDKY